MQRENDPGALMRFQIRQLHPKEARAGPNLALKGPNHEPAFAVGHTDDSRTCVDLAGRRRSGRNRQKARKWPIFVEYLPQAAGPEGDAVRSWRRTDCGIAFPSTMAPRGR